KPDEKAEERQEDPAGNPTILIGGEIHDAGGERDIERGQDEDLAAADAVAHPAPEPGAWNGAKPRRDQDRCRLTKGQLPVLQNEGQYIADQEEVEKIEHVANICRGDNFPLIGGQFLLLFQTLQHACSPGTTTLFL